MATVAEGKRLAGPLWGKQRYHTASNHHQVDFRVKTHATQRLYTNVCRSLIYNTAK